MTSQSESRLVRNGSIIGRWLTSGILGAGLLTLSFLYVRHFPTLETINDTWFGADVARHLAWMVQGVPGRAHLHPLSFALYKILGRVFRGLHILPATLKGSMLLGALPVMVAVSATVPYVAGVFASPRPITRTPVVPLLPLRYLASVIMLVAISSLVIFGPVAESHTLGGLMLLMTALITLRIYQTDAQTATAEMIPEAMILRQRNITLALLYGTAAMGFSLSNLVPAALLIGPLLRRRDGLRVACALISVVALEGILIAWRGVNALTGSRGGVVGGAKVEEQWLSAPTLQSLYLSFHNLILSQFGAPWAFLKAYPPTAFSFGAPFSGPFVIDTLAPLSCIAAGLWLIGTFLFARRLLTSRLEARFMRTCGIILVGFVLFHSVYDPEESYIFSAHVWPFVVLPGLMAWNGTLNVVSENTQKKTGLAVIACLGMATLLSVLQSVLAISHLLQLTTP